MSSNSSLNYDNINANEKSHPGKDKQNNEHSIGKENNTLSQIHEQLVSPEASANLKRHREKSDETNENIEDNKVSKHQKISDCSPNSELLDLPLKNRNVAVENYKNDEQVGDRTNEANDDNNFKDGYKEEEKPNGTNDLSNIQNVENNYANKNESSETQTNSNDQQSQRTDVANDFDKYYGYSYQQYDVYQSQSQQVFQPQQQAEQQDMSYYYSQYYQYPQSYPQQQMAYDQHYSYGSAMYNARVFVPNSKVGAVIGKNGAHLKHIREITGVRVTIGEEAVDSEERLLIISGPYLSVHTAFQMVMMRADYQAYKEVCPYFDPFASHLQLLDTTVPATVKIVFNQAEVGMLLYQSTQFFEEIRLQSGATVEVNPANHPSCAPTDQVFEITGTFNQYVMAHCIISSKIVQNAQSLQSYQYHQTLQV